MRRTDALLAAGLLVAGAAACTGQEIAAEPVRETPAGLTLISALPAEPVLAAAVRLDHPEELWDRLLNATRRFLPAEETTSFDEGLAKVDEQLGLSLRDDLLALIGPEVAVAADLPPIDMTAGLVTARSPEGLKMALSQIGMLCHVRHRERLNRTLWQLLTRAGATLEQEDTLVRATFALEDGDGGTTLTAYFGFKDDVLAAGFSTEWVRAALGRRARGDSLAEGTDFVRVMQHLDREPTALYYVNLPRVRELLSASQLLRGAMAGDPDAARVAQVLLDPATAPTGLGGSYVTVDGGMRRVTYGPSWFAGSSQAGIVAAIAVPNMLNAVGRARQKRTLADMRTVATALEAYAVDNGVYPSSNGEWVDVSTLSELLSPVYLRQVPATDGWSFPLRFWADGNGYVIVSPGRDGETEEEWRTDSGSRAVTGLDADLVYANGRFLSYPSTSGD